MFDGGSDVLGFGPWIPTESERSLMVRVRQELKHGLIQGYKEKIVARHKRGDTGEEKSWEVTRRHHLCSQSLVAIAFQMVLSY